MGLLLADKQDVFPSLDLDPCMLCSVARAIGIYGNDVSRVAHLQVVRHSIVKFSLVPVRPLSKQSQYSVREPYHILFRRMRSTNGKWWMCCGQDGLVSLLLLTNFQEP